MVPTVPSASPFSGQVFRLKIQKQNTSSLSSPLHCRLATAPPPTRSNMSQKRTSPTKEFPVYIRVPDCRCSPQITSNNLSVCLSVNKTCQHKHNYSTQKPKLLLKPQRSQSAMSLNQQTVLFAQASPSDCHQLETLFKEGRKGNKNNREPEVKELIPRTGVSLEERIVS